MNETTQNVLAYCGGILAFAAKVDAFRDVPGAEALVKTNALCVKRGIEDLQENLYKLSCEMDGVILASEMPHP